MIARAKECYQPSYNPFDPIQDTESRYFCARASYLSESYNPFDPIQDTERTQGRGHPHRPSLVTTHSIRYRILKGQEAQRQRPPGETGYNPFDPIQDTERVVTADDSHAHIYGYNPFDPIQDTESVEWEIIVNTEAKLQPIRSDTGY